MRMEINKAIDNGTFVIDSDEKANWALRKIREIKADAARQVENLDREIMRYQLEREKALKAADSECAYFEGLLNTFAAQLKENGKLRYTKSGNARYLLPDGKIKYTAPSEKWERDDDKLIQSLHAAGLNQFVRVKEAPAWSELKGQLIPSEGGGAHLEGVNPDTGEIVRVDLDGLALTVEPAKFTVETFD